MITLAAHYATFTGPESDWRALEATLIAKGEKRLARVISDGIARQRRRHTYYDVGYIPLRFRDGSIRKIEEALNDEQPIDHEPAANLG